MLNSILVLLSNCRSLFTSSKKITIEYAAPIFNKYELGINSIPLEKIFILTEFYYTSIDYLLYRTDERKSYANSIINKK